MKNASLRLLALASMLLVGACSNKGSDGEKRAEPETGRHVVKG